MSETFFPKIRVAFGALRFDRYFFPMHTLIVVLFRATVVVTLTCTRLVVFALVRFSLFIYNSAAALFKKRKKKRRDGRAFAKLCQQHFPSPSSLSSRNWKIRVSFIRCFIYFLTILLVED